MSREYSVKARTTLTDPGLSVTRFARRPRTPGNVGLALGGGGSRAASASMGVVRALHHFGLLRHVRAISSVSGGSWFAVPFTFLPDHFDEHEFLGEYLADPSELRWDVDGSLSAGNFGVPLTRLGMSLPAIVGEALRDTFEGAPADRLWTRQIGEQLLGHFDLAHFDADHHPSDFFAADETMANIIRMANPQLDHRCHLIRQSEAMPRPFLIVNGAMRVDGPTGAEVLAPVQFTPWFSGVMGSQIGTLDQLEVGGGGVSSYAFGGRWEVVHHSQLIAELAAQGRLALAPAFERVLYHEPCYLGRHNGEYEAPRAVLARVVRDAPLEFPLHREKAMCCGAGGARMWMEESIGKRINVLRVEQALPAAPTVIATACPYCAVMIGDGLKALGRDESIATRDLAELVAAALVPATAAAH